MPTMMHHGMVQCSRLGCLMIAGRRFRDHSRYGNGMPRFIVARVAYARRAFGGGDLSFAERFHAANGAF